MLSKTAMQLGYARASTADQHARLQLDALQAAGCKRIFRDQAGDDQPELAHLLDVARAGDTLVIWRLDRLAPSIRHLLATLTELDKRGVYLRSLREQWDTSAPMGRVVRFVLTGLAQMERDILIERTRDGLQAARARGRVGGRPRLMTPEKVQQAKQMLSRGCKIATVARELGVSRASIYRCAFYQPRPWGEEEKP
jgi:DNA invertase Pin-like site-specific DNA recombinase